MGTEQYISPIVPDKGAIQRLRQILHPETPHPMSPPTPPPPAELVTLSNILNDLAGELVNPSAEFSPASFDGAQAATQLEVDLGPQLQLVSFSDAYSSEYSIDRLLQDSASWGNKALAIGGLVSYSAGEPATGAVLLRRQGDAFNYEIVGERKGSSGHWQLLQLKTEAVQPYSFFTSQWLGFSQFLRQAALHHPVPAEPGTVAAAQKALTTLITKGLLPEDVNVALERARAGLVGGGSTLAQGQQSVTIPTFEPNLVVAAAVQQKEIAIGFSEAIVGAAVISVLSPTDGLAFDEQGQGVTLPAGDYRLDILDLEDPAEPIGQLLPDDQQVYYVPLVAVEILGLPADEATPEEGIEGAEAAPEEGVEGAEAVPEPGDLVVDAIYIPYCSLTGTGVGCNYPRRRKYVRIGW